MKILFISHKYPPTIGGMEKQAFELIQHTATEHEVLKLVHVAGEESKFSFFFKLRRRVKKLLAAHPDIDIIHLNDGLMGLFSLWLQSYTRIPVVITFHGLDLVFPNSIYQNRIKTKYVNYAGAICVSTATAEQALQRGFPAEKVFVVPNGVDKTLADFPFDKEEALAWLREEYGQDLSGKKVLITLGRPVKRKGFSWFLKNVMPDLPEDIFLLMVGPLNAEKKQGFVQKLIPRRLKDRIELLTGGVNDEAEIRRLLENPQLSSKVIQTGKVPFKRLLSLLNLADLFIMSNVKMEGDAEGFGLVALEASLCKTVVLASNLEGIPEAIQNQKNGHLLTSGDAAGWKQKILELSGNPEKLEQQAEDFQRFTLENYGWEKMARGYVEVFEKLRLK